MRRDIKWGTADSFLKRGKSDKDIAAWRERALAAVSEDGSSTTNGRRTVRDDGSVVHELMQPRLPPRLPMAMALPRC